MPRERSSIDIVLVKPGNQKQLYGDLSAFSLTAIEPPLWGALLAAHLRNQGYSVALFDAEVENWDYDETAKRIHEARPLAAVIVVSGTNPSASTMNMTGAGAILQKLKGLGPGIKTVLTGLHPSALPERTLQEENVDFVCQGEGFHTLPTLVAALKEGREDLNISGLWRRENDRIISPFPAPLWEDLDALPMPAWDLLPMEKYRAHNWHCFGHLEERQPYAVIYTSLGCPFRCSFCCISALFGKPGIRYRSPERVIAEIDYLVGKYQVKNIKIIDEMFALKEDHVVRLCDLIIEQGYALNLWAYARVNTVTEEMLGKMKEAGIHWIAYGFESGSKKILQDVTKGYDIDTVDRVVRMTRAAGLYICGNYIFGLPEDDLGSMKETLDLALRINAEWANFYAAAAYPGSQLYRRALEENWPLPQSWQDYSPYAYKALPLPTKYLSGPEVLRFRDEAFQRYFTSGNYLNMITGKFGEPTARHIREMASRPLARRTVEAFQPASKTI